MSDTETTPRIAPIKDAPMPDDYHIVCCNDDDIALCGIDASEMEFRPANGDDNECEVCLRLEENVEVSNDGACAICPLALFSDWSTE